MTIWFHAQMESVASAMNEDGAVASLFGLLTATPARGPGVGVAAATWIAISALLERSLL